MYELRIYASNARNIIRLTTHATWEQAKRSLYDYERRHGRHCNAIDHVPQRPEVPGC